MSDGVVDGLNQSDPPVAVEPAAKVPRTISSRDLFDGARFVIIRHEQEHYRLQVTGTGKLILTK
jgi:hemin uptake protein HemP